MKYKIVDSTVFFMTTWSDMTAEWTWAMLK